MGPGREDPPPPDEPCSEKPPLVLPTYCPLDGFEAQVVLRETRSDRSGQLVKFAIMLEVREIDRGLWLDVIRVDCSHGFVHVDKYDRAGNKRKDVSQVPPDCRDELDRARRWATDYVWHVEGRLAEWH